MAANQEEINKILETKFIQSDGKLGNVFAVHKIGSWKKYSCRLCSQYNINEHNFIQHVNGKKHKNNKPPFNNIDMETIALLSPIRDIDENGKTIKNSQIQVELNQIKDQAIIGVEYVIEVNMGENFDSVFHCVLCEGRFDSKTVISHLTAYVHRFKYLEKHFPTAFKEISDMDKREQKYHFTQKVCEGIEDNYGRLSLLVIENSEFSKNRMKFTEEVLNTKHFDEYMGCTFIELVDENGNKDESFSSFSDFEEESSSRRASLDSISTSSESYAPSNSVKSIDVISLSSTPSPSSKLSLSPVSLASTTKWKPVKNEVPILPKPNTLVADSDLIQQQTYKVEKFRLLMDAAKEELNKKYEEYRKTPIKHPDYKSEWTAFWSKRFKELRDENKVSPQSYDYTPEWYVEWKRIVDEKLKKDIESKEAEIKKQLEIVEIEVIRSEKVKSQLSEDIHVIATSIIEKARQKTKSTVVKITPTNRKREKQLKKDTTKATKRKNSRSRSRKRKRSLSSRKTRSPKRSRSPLRIRSPKRARLFKRSRSTKRSRSPTRKRIARKSRSPTDFRSNRRSRSPKRRSRSPKRRSRSPNRRSRSPKRRSRSPNRRSRSPIVQRTRSPTKQPRKSSSSPKNHSIRRSEELSSHRVATSHFRAYTSPNRFEMASSLMSTRTHHKLEYESHYTPAPPRIVKETPLSYYDTVKLTSHMELDDWHRPIRHPTTKTFPPTETYIPKKPTVPEIDEPVTIISVLSLLTALEDMLGSFAPKVIELMTKAITMDKAKANSSNQLLDDDDHCVIFETVKEKLKGLLSADIVEPSKVNAVKKAIKNMALLAHEANERQKTYVAPSEPTSTSQVASSPSISKSLPQLASMPSTPSTLSIPPAAATKEYNRDAIAAKLSAALIKEGRTDISPMQLEQLIDEYIKMANDKENKAGAGENSSRLHLAATPQSELDEKGSVSSLDMIDIQNREELVEHITKVPVPEPSSVPLRVPLRVPSRKPLPVQSPVTSSSTTKHKPVLSQPPTKKAFLNLPANAPKICPPPTNKLITSLTDSELKTLLKKFNVLSDVEQKRFKEYVQKLDKEDPERMKRLRRENLNLMDECLPRSNFGSPTVEKGDKIMYPSSKVQIAIQSKPGTKYSPFESLVSDDEENTKKSNKNAIAVENDTDSDDSTNTLMLASSIANTQHQIAKMNRDLNPVKTGMKIPVVNTVTDAQPPKIRRIETVTLPRDSTYVNPPAQTPGTSGFIRPYHQQPNFGVHQQQFQQQHQQSYHQYPQQYPLQRPINPIAQIPIPNPDVNYYNQPSMQNAPQPQYHDTRLYQNYNYQHPPY